MVPRNKVCRQVSDVCLFCAFRYGTGVRQSAPRLGYQVRSYKSSIATQRPATATARIDDDEDDDYTPSRRYNHQQDPQSNQWGPPIRDNRRPYGGFEQGSSRGSKPHQWSINRGTATHPSQADAAQRESNQYNRQRRNNPQPQRPNAENPTSDASGARNNGSKFGAFLSSLNTNEDKTTQEQGSRSRFARGNTQRQPRWNNQFDDGSLNPDANQAAGRMTQYTPRFSHRENAPSADNIARSIPSRAWSRTDEGPPSSQTMNRQRRKDPSATIESLPKPTPTVSLLEGDEESTRRRQTKAKDDRRSRMFDIGEEVSEPTASLVYGKKRGRIKQTGAAIQDLEAQLEEDALYNENTRRGKKKAAKSASQRVRPTVQLPEYISVEKLAQTLKVRLNEFVAKLEEEGYEGARYDHILDYSTSTIFAELYGFDVSISESESKQDLIARPAPEDPSVYPPRPPIVTIMGHVDHGKTTILDWLRKSSVVATEHGGITQHIGAFSFKMPGSERQITFLDTPGHSAFLEMRRRGANVTDIVVLVVAADDSVKPQTIEAIKHALEAKVQIIVAINKVDKEDSNIDRVKQDLSRHNISVEDYGGEYQAIPVSGKTGQGMADLEEAILTLADVNDFRAETDGAAEGWIIESKVTSAGRTATILVRRGTLRPGDFIVAGTTWARVRTLRNDAGQLVTEAPPGTPVQVDGWRGTDPMAGMEVLQADNEDHAKKVMDLRLEALEATKSTGHMEAINAARTEEAEARAKVLAWEAEQDWSKKSIRHRPKDNEGWVEPENASGPKRVHFVIKADVAGSVEAVAAAVSAIGNNEIAANVIHTGTGELTESDIKLLASTGEVGYAISFNQPIDGAIRRLSEAASLRILDHNIIYKVTDDVKDKLSDELPPTIMQKVLGEAEVGQIFEIGTKKGKIKIAGCKITNGTVSRSEKIRVSRNAQVVYTGSLSSLKNVKKDVTEMRKGTECGMGFDNWEDFQEGDQIQCFSETKEKRRLY